MAVDITIPSPGESVTEVVIGPWTKSDGDWVEKDEPIVEIESDKVTLEVPAPESGVLHINASEGDEKNVGDRIGSIDPSADKPAGEKATANGKAAEQKSKKKEAEGKSAAATATAEATDSDNGEEDQEEESTVSAAGDGAVRATSVARKIARDKGIDLNDVKGSGPAGRIQKSDVLAASEQKKEQQAAPQEKVGAAAPAGGVDGQPAGVTVGYARGVRRQKMSKLRQRIAERLVDAQHTAAMLTTFNEADMSEVIRLRKQYKETFEKKYGIGLGFMSFFVKACAAALLQYPETNAYIVNNEFEYHDFVDISIAVGTPKGLVVPVLRNAEQMSFAQIEAAIRDLATRARDGKLTIDEMQGGTFTITNGGVYGSLNSTPILNPPQSAILGMHAIKNRPVEDPNNPGELALRPMMYLALSYDHRIIDGQTAVTFLVHVKEQIENPERMLLDL